MDSPEFPIREQPTPIDKETYFGKFGEIIQNVTERAGGTEGWWVIGGLARDAITGNETEFIKPDGHVKDVDIIFSNSLKHLGPELQKENKSPLYIGTSLQNVVNVEPNEKASLKLGKVEVAIPPETFTTEMQNLHGVDFPTLPPETLYYLYCAGYRPDGKMREKDIKGAKELADHLVAKPNPKYPSALYTPYLTFYDQTNKDVGFNLSKILMEAGQKYMSSRMNDVIPLNSPKIRKPLEKVWGLVQKAQKPPKR